MMKYNKAKNLNPMILTAVVLFVGLLMAGQLVFAFVALTVALTVVLLQTVQQSQVQSKSALVPIRVEKRLSRRGIRR